MNKQSFDFSVDLLKVILWQYDDAEKLQSLLHQKQQWYQAHQSNFWENWLKDVFDLRTANEFGLAVWAYILEMPMIAEVGASEMDAPGFCFSELNENFENGNFFADSSSVIG